MVAVADPSSPPPQHSPMLGHLASSQTFKRSNMYVHTHTNARTQRRIHTNSQTQAQPQTWYSTIQTLVAK